MSLDASLDRKVKAEPATTLSLEPTQNPAMEIAVLKALLARKANELVDIEIKYEKKLLAVQTRVKSLEIQRAADAAKIESLEAQIPGNEVGLAGTRSSVAQSKKASSSQVIEYLEVVDSDEEDGDKAEASPTSAVQTPKPPQKQPAPASTWSERLLHSRRAPDPVIKSPTPSANGTLLPAESGSSPMPTPNDRSTSTADVPVKEESFDVKIKTEGGSDQFKRVSLVKSEDGKFDIWNVDSFGLRPAVELDTKYTRGFHRKVIGDAFGGGRQECFHHWNLKPGQEDQPFVTLKRTWCHSLPTKPGAHGIAFCDLTDSPLGSQPLNFFVGEGGNDWRLIGTYNFVRGGEIAPSQTSLIPASVVECWVKGTLKTCGGKAKVDAANATLDDSRKISLSYESVLRATRDGRLVIPFAVLECVGYPEAWFERLLYYEEHPKPDKAHKAPGTPRKRRAAKAGKQAVAKRLQKGKRTVKEESDSDSSGEEFDDGDSDDSDFEGPRRIAALPRTRTSPRKARATSVEI
ncbi:hypothetical protein GGX14DRAFT_626738 [Mycena pura]|uniref:DUF6697 domain-containing protein n=1 Tax=Mycena pura TaxID=153505 RepID=A0AAD6YQR1_9AGAR|nr:hypothetical protein GGX14DRAFT_626738 [Mycena pura]